MKKRNVKFVCLIIAVFMMLSIMPINVWAVDEKHVVFDITIENDSIEYISKDIGIDNNINKINIEVLARKAIEEINEMANLQPEFYRNFKYDDIKNIRELYTPTTNIIIGYAFEFENNGDFCYVVMNAITQEFMQMGAGQSSYSVYLEDVGKTKLEENQKFIYDSIACWVGTIQGDEITIVDVRTDEIVAMEHRG